MAPNFLALLIEKKRRRVHGDLQVALASVTTGCICVQSQCQKWLQAGAKEALSLIRPHTHTLAILALMIITAV